MKKKTRKTGRTKIKEAMKDENNKSETRQLADKLRKNSLEIKSIRKEFDNKLDRSVRRSVSKALEKPVSYKKLKEFIEEEYGGLFNVVQAILLKRLLNTIRIITNNSINNLVNQRFAIETKTIKMDVLKLSPLGKKGWRLVYWGKIGNNDKEDSMILQRPKKIKHLDVHEESLDNLKQDLEKALKSMSQSPKYKQKKIKRKPLNDTKRKPVRAPVKEKIKREPI